MIESIQYNATLAITGTIRGSSREKLYQDDGTEIFVFIIKSGITFVHPI